MPGNQLRNRRIPLNRNSQFIVHSLLPLASLSAFASRPEGIIGLLLRGGEPGAVNSSQLASTEDRYATSEGKGIKSRVPDFENPAGFAMSTALDAVFVGSVITTQFSIDPTSDHYVQDRSCRNPATCLMQLVSFITIAIIGYCLHTYKGWAHYLCLRTSVVKAKSFHVYGPD